MGFGSRGAGGGGCYHTKIYVDSAGWATIDPGMVREIDHAGQAQPSPPHSALSTRLLDLWLPAELRSPSTLLNTSTGPGKCSITGGKFCLILGSPALLER